MLSPQAKTFLFNSPKKCQTNEPHTFLAKTCSSTVIRSQHSDKQQAQEVDQQKLNYSKLLKQKDLKILNLTQKLKSIEKELSVYKSQHSTLSYDLKFFKSKIQEEFYRNVCMESEIEIINSALKGFIMKIMNLLQGNNKSMQSFAKHLQSLKVDSTEHDHSNISKKLVSTMDFQIAQLAKSFYLLKKEPEVQMNLVKSAELKYESYQRADQIQKDSLRKHINQLIDYYETKLVNSDDYNQELLNLRKQRQYIKELLVSSERDKNQFANQIYETARKEHQVDFERMNKSDVVKFCLGLLAKIKELEHDKSHLQEQIRNISTTEKQKYENMLRLVKKLERASDKKVSIKRLNSMPYY